MKYFILSAIVLGVTAMRMEDNQPVPNLEVSPTKMNTSPNPVPREGYDKAGYGETITSEKPVEREPQEEQEEKRRKKLDR